MLKLTDTFVTFGSISILRTDDGMRRFSPSSTYDVLYNNINSYYNSLVIGGHTMDNIILNIINCILLILVKNVLDIEYIIPL